MSFSRIIIEQRLADLELALKRQEELIDSQRDAIRTLRDLIARDQLSNGLATVAIPPPAHVAEVKTPLQGTPMNPPGPYAYGIVDPTTGHVNYAMPPPHSAAPMARPSPSPSPSVSVAAPATLGPRTFTVAQESHLDSSQDMSMVSASSSAPGSTVKRMRLLESSPATLNTSRSTPAPVVQPLKRRRALDRIRQLANLFPPLSGGGAAMASPPPAPAPVVNAAPTTTTPAFRPHAPVVQSTPSNGAAASASKAATRTVDLVATSTTAASATKPVAATPIIHSAAPKGFNYNGVQSPAAAAQGPSFSNSSSSLVAIPSAAKSTAASAAPSTTPVASTLFSSSAKALVPSSAAVVNSAGSTGRAPEVAKGAAAVSPLSTGTSTTATSTTNPLSEAPLATRPATTPAASSASSGHTETLTKSVSASALSTASSSSSAQIVVATEVDAAAAPVVTPSKIVVQMDELSLGRSNTTAALRAKLDFVRSLPNSLQPTGTSVAQLLQTHGAKKILLSWLKRLEEDWEELPVEGIMLLELTLNLFATEASFAAPEVLENRIDKLLRRVYKKYSHQKLSLGDALLERIRTLWATYRSLYKDAAGDDAAD